MSKETLERYLAISTEMRQDAYSTDSWDITIDRLEMLIVAIQTFESAIANGAFEEDAGNSPNPTNSL